MSEGIPGGAAKNERLAGSQRVAVLDAGGQYVDLVLKAVERQGIPADLLDLRTPLEELEGNYAALIISGSPASSHEETAPQPDGAIWGSDLPVLGICYGMQAMALAHGGKVTRNGVREDGRVTTAVQNTHPLFYGSKEEFTALFTHGDFVTELPEGFTAIGEHTLGDGMTAYSAMADGNKIGVQFHPEVFDDTPGGYEVFSNFLHGVASLEADQDFQEARLEQLIAKKQSEIYRQVGERHVIAFVSGGVDSSVAVTLAAGIIEPDKLHAYFIDNGFMRDEDDLVIEQLQEAGINVRKIDATTKFERATLTEDGITHGPLVEVTDPQIKRKIIGKTFIDVQNDILAELGLDDAVLLQGTNAADRIESGNSKGGQHTDQIKLHHNQVPQVQELKALGRLVEPLDDQFKDEIRALGHELDLPWHLVERQPFPGPGTAIRIIGAARSRDTLEPAPIEGAIREFVEAEYDRDDIAAHVLPIRTVGVGGDERSYISVVAIDNAGLTTGDTLASLAKKIPEHFRGEVNRVIFALGQQALAGRTVTKTLLGPQERNQLRRADSIVFDAMRQYDLLGKIKQMPVVLLPISFDQPGDRSIVLRPVTTSTFMTVQAMLPNRDLPEDFFNLITRRVLGEVSGISQVFLDLTNKPPGTTEWE